MTSTLICSTQAFAKLCSDIADSPYIALDTEFMRNKTYWAQLCLLQIADKGNENQAVIDCLAPDLDLSPLADVLKNPNIVKVFHAGRQDIEIFYHHFGFLPSPIFDTQIASMACGFGDQIGYDVLVKRTVGVEISKAGRLKDWRARPLSQQDLAYALGDVVHLTKAYEHVLALLEERGRLSWIEEEMAKLAIEESYYTDPDWAWLKLKLKGSRIYRSILRELASFREREAQRLNIPRGFVIKDDVIYGIANAVPRDYDSLCSVTAIFGKNYKGKLANSLLDAVERGVSEVENLPQVDIEKKVKGSVVLDILKLILKITADEHNISSRLIASNETLSCLIAGNCNGLAVMRGWRYEIFGKRAEALLRGDLHLSLKGGRVCLESSIIAGLREDC